MDEPPTAIVYNLEEAVTLAWDLENARDTLSEVEPSARWPASSSRSSLSTVSCLQREAEVVDSIADKAHQQGALTLAEAARLSGIPGLDLTRAVIERRIRTLMVEGIPHIPIDALDEYRRDQAS